VSERDFRIVHFADRALVIVPVPAGLDPHLAARIARERYEVPLSLARAGESEVLLLGAQEGPGGRTLDVSAMVDHLGEKLDGVEVLPDDDHAARLRLRGLAANPERLDALVSEIAMGRSILDG
jgi:hypothetical protein